MSAKNVNDQNFQSEVLDSSTPVLVDFWAPWCGPCRTMVPVVDELAGEVGDGFKVVKVNIDDSPNSAAGFGVSSIPPLMVFKGGEVLERLVGVLGSKSQSHALKKLFLFQEGNDEPIFY